MTNLSFSRFEKLLIKTKKQCTLIITSSHIYGVFQAFNTEFYDRITL